MKLKHIYGLICLLSIVATYLPLSIFIKQHGFDMVLLFKQLFALPSTSFFGMDLLVVSVVALIFIIFESKRLGMKNLWLPIASIFLVGISLALPLFLFLREKHLTDTKNKL